MATPLTWIEAPARAPRPNTILSTIPVHDVSAEHFIGYQFIPDPCGFPQSVPQGCYVQWGPAAETVRVFGEPGEAVTTRVFGAYQGIECFLNGGLDEFRAVAQRVLEQGEHRVVEDAVGQTLFDIALLATNQAITSVQEAIGHLEDALSAGVPARGYIYLSPLGATLAAAEGILIRTPDGALQTYLGTPVVVMAELAAELTAYASGPINLWRTPVDSVEAPNWTINQGRALAERLYSLSIECGAWYAPFTQDVIPDPEPEPDPDPDPDPDAE